MKRKGLERNLVIFLFMVVLVMFSLADRASKKFEHYYSTARIVKTGAQGVTYSASKLTPARSTNN